MKKRRLTALVAAVLLLTMVPMWPTGAQTVWVYTKNGKTLNLRDEYTNKVIGHIPYGTKLETDPSKDAQTAAYVTYKGVSGSIAFDATGDAVRDTAYIKSANTETGVWDFVAVQGVN